MTDEQDELTAVVKCGSWNTTRRRGRHKSRAGLLVRAASPAIYSSIPSADIICFFYFAVAKTGFGLKLWSPLLLKTVWNLNLKLILDEQQVINKLTTLLEGVQHYPKVQRRFFILFFKDFLCSPGIGMPSDKNSEIRYAMIITRATTTTTTTADRWRTMYGALVVVLIGLDLKRYGWFQLGFFLTPFPPAENKWTKIMFVLEITRIEFLLHVCVHAASCP